MINKEDTVVAITTINAATLAKMFLSGAAHLDAKKEWINELNVFPVPDGDTGTNMTLTIMSAAREVSALSDVTLPTLAKAISFGSLRGARGNSGVILSQLFRGFTKIIGESNELTCGVLAEASVKAVETAYKAVMKPKEGTILTVARGISEKAVELADSGCDDIKKFMEEVIAHGDYVLSQTPEMLPVLKEAGVVDSGGQGLMQVMKGALDGLLGRELDLSIEGGSAPAMGKPSAQAEADIKFGYCTEFIIMLDKEFTEKDETKFKAYLESIGDSIVCVAMDDIVKVHVHTNEPGNAIQKGLSYGALTSMKIDNMREEHEEKLFKEAQKQEAMEQAAKAQEPRKEYGFVAVSIGEGMNEIFKGLGVDYLIEGGQTMNPSTEDMLNAIDNVNADTIFILPNNKNIILAANQARDLTEDKNIVVMETKTVPQGISALIAFSPDASVEENQEAMAEEIAHVKTGQVTYAVRDTNIDGFDIEKEDIMGIGDKGLLAVGKEIEETALEMIGKMVDEESGLISLFYGQEVSAEDAEGLMAKVEEAYPDCDVELQSGGQPIYYYVVSVE